MTETEYVISNFKERFLPFRDLRIALHGSRDYAREIIRHFAGEFRFVGVMSRDELPDPEFCGLPVLREADLPSPEIDMVLLTERVKYAEAVYQDLRGVCKKAGIQLFNMYGVDELEAHRDIARCLPLDFSGWAEICRGCQIVAFEAMDTLLAGPDLAVRDTFRSLISWLFSRGTDVRVSLRKSFPADRQIAALRASGLFPNLDGQLIVRQGEDLSFRALREENPGKKILYIGNGLVNECLLPRCYGIDTYRFTDTFADFGVPVLDEEPAHIPHDGGRKERLRQAIRESAVVSFDVFDTLLVRKTLRPDDVFELAELRGRAAGYPAGSFAGVRREAVLSCRGGTIYDIYNHIRDVLGWSEETAAAMLELELKVEADVMIPRTEVAELLDFALSEGKTVVLTEDTYLPEPLFRRLLAEKGIRSYDRLLVSRDARCPDRAGLFGELRRLAADPGTVLHIGDDTDAGLCAASRCGIRAERIPSAAALAAARGWAESVRTAKTLAERCLIGMTIALLFRDPFQNPNLLERPAEERLRRFADSVLGPLAAGYMTWLISKLREREYDGVLFLARDGYLPIQVYRELSVVPRLPDPVYFYANRHSTFLCCADDPALIPDILARGTLFHLDAAALLRRVYNLSEEELLPPERGESGTAYILRHMPLIRERAQAGRKAYEIYCERCGIKKNGTYAVVDFIAAGTTQRNMARFLPFAMQGFYFGNYSAEDTDRSFIAHYLTGGSKSIIRNFIELESFFISPEPPVDTIAEDGSVVFQAEPRTEKELSEYLLAFSAARDYMKEFFRLFYQEGDVIRPELPEAMFAAEGYHGVQRSAYDDLCMARHHEKLWMDGT